jgi:SpoVK/Ycf46/Vps4 family AAA+-type ATPase
MTHPARPDHAQHCGELTAASLRSALTTRNGAREESTAALDNSMGAVLPELLTTLPPAPLADVRLVPRGRRVLDEVVVEHHHRDLLESHGLGPRAKLFFYGPPGCGKTFAARALATKLGMSALVVRFDGLLGAYLGQTSLRLREVFRFAARLAHRL